MKYLKTFEEFINESYALNEAREWTDWDTSKIVRKYIRDIKNDKSLGADDLAGFMDHLANQKIEESPEEWYVEDIIQELVKKGFKNMKIEDFIKGWEQSGNRLDWNMNENFKLSRKDIKSLKKDLQDFDEDMNMMRIYGEPDIDAVIKRFIKTGDAEEAAESISMEYSDQDGGEDPHGDEHYDQLVDTFKQYTTNESYNLNENFKWDKKKGVIIMGRKKIDPREIDFQWVDKTEMWADIDTDNATDQNGKELNKKEKLDLSAWLSGAYGDAQDDWYDMFNGHTGWD